MDILMKRQLLKKILNCATQCIGQIHGKKQKESQSVSPSRENNAGHLPRSPPIREICRGRLPISKASLYFLHYNLWKDLGQL